MGLKFVSKTECHVMSLSGVMYPYVYLKDTWHQTMTFLNEWPLKKYKIFLLSILWWLSEETNLFL